MIDANAIYADGRTYEQHRAWLEGMSPDEKLVVSTPDGYKGTMIVVADAKRTLATQVVPPAEIEKILGYFDKFIDNFFTAEALAVIKPAGDAEHEMLMEARKLTSHDRWRVMENWDAFNAILKLNPSLMDCIRICHRTRSA